MFGYIKYFLNYKNIWFLFVTTDKQYDIYELKNYSLQKKLLFQNMYYVLLSEISNKMCFIISYNWKIIIMDFINNDTIYKFYTNKTQYLFLWNRYIIIENYQIVDNAIINLFNGERETVFNDYFFGGLMKCLE